MHEILLKTYKISFLALTTFLMQKSNRDYPLKITKEAQATVVFEIQDGPRKGRCELDVIDSVIIQISKEWAEALDQLTSKLKNAKTQSTSVITSCH